MRFKSSDSEFYDLPGNFYANMKPVLTDRAGRLDTLLAPMSKQSKSQSLQESVLFKSVFFDDNLKASDVVQGLWRDLKILLRRGKGRKQNNNKMYSNFWDLRNDSNHWKQCILYPVCGTLSCNPGSITITDWIISLIPKICNHNHLNHFLLPAWAQKKKCNQRGTKKVYRSSTFVVTWQSLGILTFVTSKF